MNTATFGPVKLKLDILQKPHNGIVITPKSIDFLIKDIKENGLINPLEVRIINSRNIVVDRGNQRVYVLKKLKYKKAPCYISLQLSNHTEDMYNILKLLLPTVESIKRKPTKYDGFK